MIATILFTKTVKTILFIIVSIIVLFSVIKEIKDLIITSQLHKYSVLNKEKLNKFIDTLTNETIDSGHTFTLANLIHKYLISEWLYKNQLNGSLETAKIKVEYYEIDQAKIISDLNKFFQTTIGGKKNSLQNLIQAKDNGLELGAEKMKKIFENPFMNK